MMDQMDQRSQYQESAMPSKLLGTFSANESPGSSDTTGVPRVFSQIEKALYHFSATEGFSVFICQSPSFPNDRRVVRLILLHDFDL